MTDATSQITTAASAWMHVALMALGQLAIARAMDRPRTTVEPALAAERMARSFAIVQALPEKDNALLALLLRDSSDDACSSSTSPAVACPLQHARALWSWLHGRRCVMDSMTFERFAWLHECLGAPAEAEWMYRRALAGDTAETRLSRQDAALTRISLADLLVQEGRPAEALPLLESAISHYDETHGPDHVAACPALQVLHAALQALDRGAEAISVRDRIARLQSARAAPSDAGELLPFTTSREIHAQHCNSDLEHRQRTPP